MELTELKTVVMGLVLVGMVIGIGLIVLGGFSNNPGLYMSRTVTGESVTWPNYTKNVSLAHIRVSVSRVYNDTTSAVVTTDYTVFGTAGKIKNNKNTTTCNQGDTCYVDYVWEDRNPPVSRATSNVSAQLASISTSWLSLVVIVVCMVLILGLVIRNLAANRR